MTNPSHNFPLEYRCNVNSQNQFELPSQLVSEVGFKSTPVELVQGAMVGWYYHKEQDKAVLANKKVERSSLELVGASSLSGVSNDDLDLEPDDVNSARTTIIDDLPTPLYERLTTAGRIVLKPLYCTEYSQLTSTCISIYPEREYDDGNLQNVTYNRRQASDNEAGPNNIGYTGKFTDFV